MLGRPIAALATSSTPITSRIRSREPSRSLREMGSSSDSSAATLARISWSSRSASVGLPRSLSSVSYAGFSPRWAATSQRGLSGWVMMPIIRTSAGTAPRPIIQRHAPDPWNARSTRYARKMPVVTISCMSEDRPPRMFFGASSLRYMGTITETMPTPTPITNRKKISMNEFTASAAPPVPSTKTTPPAKISFLRPSLSASRPEPRAPSMAPSSSPLTTMPSTSGVGMMCSGMNGSAPPITPVS